MAASLWAKAVLRGVAGCSRQAVSSPSRQYGRTVSKRWASAVAVQEESASPSVTPVDVPLAPDELSLHSDQPTFSTLKGSVSHDTLKAIMVKPFNLKHMSPVQAAVLPLLPALAEPYDPEAPSDAPTRDILVKARTGTGKTLAFLVPAIEARLKAIQAYSKQAAKDAGRPSDKSLEERAARLFTRTEVGTLVISPTRELATQIANEALRLSHHHTGFEVRLFVGGNSKKLQMRDWMRGRRDIVVATPGRLRDLLESEPEVSKGIAKARTLILDEADTLLDMGFRDDIDGIIQYLPKTPERQTMMFSATVSPAIRQVARATLDKNHIFINCVSDSAPPVHSHIPQYHTVLPSAEQQLPHVLRLLAQDQLLNAGKAKSIVFLPTTKMTQLYATFLRELSKTCLPSGRNTHVYEMHSKRQQGQRDSTSSAFRNDQSGAAILVSSDVSARGVDYPGVTRVIQVGIPSGTDLYVHRVGRTGRGNNVSGRADLVLLPWEMGFVTWHLTDVPLKPLTTNELTNQVKELAAQYDANLDVSPAAADTQRTGRQRGGAPQKYTPYSASLEAMPDNVSALLSQIDESAVEETMTSLLGYYVGKVQELRVQKGVIVQGCKDWTVEACGLSTPPFISEAFLRKLGLNDGRSKDSGRARSDQSRYGRASSGGSEWTSRGSNYRRPQETGRGDFQRGGRGGREDRKYGYEASPRDSRDFQSSPAEYRGSRFRR
ncbi:P-loop containing nucleoside triphosphate hydrolase protein [Amylocystis lapponica]|nr:P-loop containing nucleoside triphosphate hydrolase protein [Amylocystis lapponica]